MAKLRSNSGRLSRRGPTTTALLVTLGAAAGIALGLVLAERAGGLDGLARRAGLGRPRRPRAGGWRDDASRGDYIDDLDDDEELSPESIAHMHVHGHVAGHAGGEGAADDRERAKVRPLPVRPIPDEATLESRVLEAFLNDPILRERAIDICAAGPGTIELTGWVQASGEIGHALTLARGVPDVRKVVDRLAVRGGAPSRDHSTSRYEAPLAN